MPRGSHRAPKLTTGYTSTASEPATSTHAITRSACCAISSTSIVERDEREDRERRANGHEHLGRACRRLVDRTDVDGTGDRRSPGYVGHRSYDIDVTLLGDGPSDDEAGPAADTSAPVAGTDATVERVDIDVHSAVPIAIAFAVLAVTIWLVRSIPRTLTLTAIASLLAVALMPGRRSAAPPHRLATPVRRRTRARGDRRDRDHDDRARDRPDDQPDPHVQQGDSEDRRPARQPADHRSPSSAKRTPPRRCGTGSTTCRSGSTSTRRRSTNAAGTIADGVVATLSALLLAITSCSTANDSCAWAGQLVPPGRRADADRFGRLVYNVVGRYIAGTLFIAAARRSRDAHHVAGARCSARAAARGVDGDLQPDAADRRLPRGGAVRRVRPERERARRRRSASWCSSSTSSSRTTCCSR